MKTYPRLPDAELTVMQLIWSMQPPVTSAEIQARAVQDWKATSVLTFLSRLTEKGFLACRKEGKHNMYTPLVSERDYKKQEGASFVRRLYNGSVRNLVASLSDAGALSESDLDELRAFLAEKEGES